MLKSKQADGITSVFTADGTLYPKAIKLVWREFSGKVFWIRSWTCQFKIYISDLDHDFEGCFFFFLKAKALLK